jgi:HEPN domain-containing protein
MDDTHIYEWFQFGDTDLKVAEHLSATLYPPPLEIICYHCQQAVEKYLKGYLVFTGTEEPPKIHNLMALCASCARIDNRFDTIVAKCNILNAYGVQPRYPDEIYIDESQMKKALLYACEIKTFEPLTDCRKILAFGSTGRSKCRDTCGD